LRSQSRAPLVVNANSRAHQEEEGEKKDIEKRGGKGKKKRGTGGKVVVSRRNETQQSFWSEKGRKKGKDS